MKDKNRKWGLRKTVASWSPTARLLVAVAPHSNLPATIGSLSMRLTTSKLLQRPTIMAWVTMDLPRLTITPIQTTTTTTIRSTVTRCMIPLLMVTTTRVRIITATIQWAMTKTANALLMILVRTKFKLEIGNRPLNKTYKAFLWETEPRNDIRARKSDKRGLETRLKTAVSA